MGAEKHRQEALQLSTPNTAGKQWPTFSREEEQGGFSRPEEEQGEISISYEEQRGFSRPEGGTKEVQPT